MSFILNIPSQTQTTNWTGHTKTTSTFYFIYQFLRGAFRQITRALEERRWQLDVERRRRLAKRSRRIDHALFAPNSIIGIGELQFARARVSENYYNTNTRETIPSSGSGGRRRLRRHRRRRLRCDRERHDRRADGCVRRWWCIQANH